MSSPYRKDRLYVLNLLSAADKRRVSRADRRPISLSVAWLRETRAEVGVPQVRASGKARHQHRSSVSRGPEGHARCSRIWSQDRFRGWGGDSLGSLSSDEDLSPIVWARRRLSNALKNFEHVDSDGLGRAVASKQRVLAMADATNLQVMRPGRKKPVNGDIFAVQLRDGRFLFGRVVRADLPRDRAPMPGSYLVYVYDFLSESKAPPARLTPDRLLIPPTFTNRLPWTKGYFETIDNRAISRADLVAKHCFRRWTGDYVDEDGSKLPAPIEPCGEWGLTSYRMLDDLISDAVGIPRAPE